MSANLETAVEATIERVAALESAEAALERRRAAIRAMYVDEQVTKSDIFVMLHNALKERGLTEDQLRNSGVSYHSIVLTLRDR